MKIITYSKVGYNAPSQANWAYGIWKVDLIDTEREYCHSYTVKENFGGDILFRRALQAKGIKVIEVKGVYTGTGTPKITGVAKLPDMDSDVFINQIIKEYEL